MNNDFGQLDAWTDAELEELGVRSVTSGGRIFCGVTAQEYAISGVTYRWAKGSHITLGLEFSSLGKLSDMDVKDAMTAALKEISDCCDITHEIIKSADLANIYLRRQRLDGAFGVLADCEIPPVNATPDSTRLRMRLDDSEGWVISETPGQNEIDFYRVFLHEIEHGHGLGHKPANINVPALIAPTYSRTIRHLQAADKSELVRRYGEAAAPTPAPEPPADKPVPGALPVNYEGVHTIEQSGKVWRGTVKGVLARVK